MIVIKNAVLAELVLHQIANLRSSFIRCIGSSPIHCAAGNLIAVVSRRDIAIVVIRQIDLFICGRERVLYGSIPAPGVCGTSKKYHSTVFYNP